MSLFQLGNVKRFGSWNGGFENPWTSSWPWNGALASRWALSGPWNGCLGGPRTSSWPWNRGFGSPGTPSRPRNGDSGALGRPRASQRRLGSVAVARGGVNGAPQDRPKGAPGRPGTPERAPGSVRERAEATQIDAKSRPGTKKSSFLRTVRSQTDFRPIFARFALDFRMIAQVVRGALSQQISGDFRFGDAKPDPHETSPTAMFREGRRFRSETTRSSDRGSLEKVRKSTRKSSRGTRARSATKSLENRPQNRPKIVEIDSRSLSGALHERLGHGLV